MVTSAAERAELESKLSASVISAFQAGLLTKEEALAELRARGEELGCWGRNPG